MFFPSVPKHYCIYYLTQSVDDLKEQVRRKENELKDTRLTRNGRQWGTGFKIEVSRKYNVINVFRELMTRKHNVINVFRELMRTLLMEMTAGFDGYLYFQF